MIDTEKLIEAIDTIGQKPTPSLMQPELGYLLPFVIFSSPASTPAMTVPSSSYRQASKLFMHLCQKSIDDWPTALK